MNELWRVQLGTGEVRMMTIDDLDRAFDAGYIHSRTNVLAPGSFTWTTLGDAAGLDEPAPYVEQTPSLAPMAIAGNGYAFPQIPQHQPYAMGASFGLDDDLDGFGAKKSKKGVIAGFLIAGAAAVCAFFVTTSSHVESTASSGVHVESKAAAAALAPAAEQKLPEAAKPAEAPKPAETTAGKMADDVKKKLLEADKERETKLKAKGKGKRRKASAAPEGETNSQPAPPAHKMVEGGDKYDPLNGSI